MKQIIGSCRNFSHRRSGPIQDPTKLSPIALRRYTTLPTYNTPETNLQCEAYCCTARNLSGFCLQPSRAMASASSISGAHDTDPNGESPLFASLNLPIPHVFITLHGRLAHVLMIACPYVQFPDRLADLPPFHRLH